MPLRFAANLSFLFPDLPWEQRFAAAARSGFPGVEMNPPTPYDVPSARFAALLRDDGLTCPLLVGPIGTGSARFGHACVPGERGGFGASVVTMLDYAVTAGVPLVHVSAGLAPAGVPRAEVEAVYVENIAWTAEQAASAGVRLCIEPVCEMRTPGFFLQTTTQALDLIARTGRSDIGLIFDVFHVEMQEGSALDRLPVLLPHIAHVQVSDTPDRHMPGTGMIPFAAIFAGLETAGYAGWIGCEYTPEPDSSGNLEWAQRWMSV
ncbi:TIM barrel protein [Sphingosinicella sp. LHD-64]|uniref:hydroxypyruvate isomerase family protein n=1 Tax=Sphingosinicella sp. LHD-64 TaxID=3072139 RepID=UPI00280CE895|nr:TIM barrel protein [Sphingosinicella sp. LHD-64]MDQ8757587.1 TIM barrel protein [Sphingosinicella sp. LHD-64]